MTMTINRYLFLIVGVLLCATQANAQAPAVYENEAAFLAAVGSPTLIDFEGIADPGSPVFLGNPGLLETDGVTFSNNSQMFVQNIDAQYGTGSFLSPQGADPQGLFITLPENTIAVGFSYAYADTSTAVALIGGGGGEFALSAPGFGSMGFVGFARESGFTSFLIAVEGPGIDIDNFWFVVDPNPSPFGTFTNEATFLAELESSTLIDFEGIAAPGEDVYLGNPGVFAESDVTINTNSQMFVRNIVDSIYETGAFLAPQGADPQVVNIELPVSTVAVGFSYGYRIWGNPSATVIVNDSETYVLPPDLNGDLYFFGIIRDTPIESLTITVDGLNIDIDNVRFTVDPSVRPVRYLDEAAFLAAVDSPILIDFEGIVDPGESVDYGNPGAYIEKGVRFANESNMFVQNTDLYGTQSRLSPQGTTPQSVLIQLPQNTTAVGFSYSSPAATVLVNGSEQLNLPAQPVGTLGFFGIVRDAPIESVLLSIDGIYIDIDHVWFVAGPGVGGLNVPGGGEVDTSFGTNGVLLLNDLLQSDFADFFGLGVQPGGGIVIAGTKYINAQEPVVLVARIGLSGALDTTFGDGGTRSVYVGIGGGFAWDMKVLSDGSILVSGRGDFSSGDSTSFVFKLDANGDVDTTFGSNGIVSENLDVTPGLPPDGYERVVVRANGKILLGTPGLGVHQFDANGNRDMNFGLSGVAQPENSDWSSYGLAEAADGKVIFGGGTAFFDSPQDFIVGRYMADGSALDASFGNGGVTSAQVGLSNDELLDLVVDSEDRIVAVGYTEVVGFSSYRTAIVRFLPNGQLDPTFAYGGIRLLDGIGQRDLYITRVIPRPDGGLLLSGEAIAPLPLLSPEIFVMSLNEDGTLDETFAGKGWQELDVAPDPEERPNLRLLRDAMTIHPAGKIVVLNWLCACMTMLEAPQWGDKTGGDLDADGKSDILWRNNLSGQNWSYLMDGPSISSSENINTVGTIWTIAGTGDYNGDGKADILWRNGGSGQNWMYLMDGATIVSSAGVNTVASSNWQVVGNGDYNGDGKSDILWRNNSSGRNPELMYLMDGATIISSVNVNTVPTIWQVAGSGDYDGDGKSDILWRHGGSGQNWLYRMDGATITSSIGINSVSTVWNIVGDGDYNGDGKADILWRHSGSGQNWLYLMDGATIVSSAGINTVPMIWDIVGDGDYNGDGKSDILWRNSTTGQNWMYLMNGSTVSSSQEVNKVSDLNWQVVDVN